MRIYTKWPQQAGKLLSKPISIKMGGFACQWLGNADMHMYAKCDKNVPCGFSFEHFH